MSNDAARLVDELTTLLYEPLKGKCLTHTPCVIVACGACHQKADKREAVVHENDCPVYRLQRAEAANTAVIRANAEEIADLEDVRDALEAKVNALTAEVERLTQDLGDARAQLQAALGLSVEQTRGLYVAATDSARHAEQVEAERDALAAQVAKLREAGEALADYVEHQPFSLARLAAIEAWRAALAAAGGEGQRAGDNDRG